MSEDSVGGNEVDLEVISVGVEIDIGAFVKDLEDWKEVNVEEDRT